MELLPCKACRYRSQHAARAAIYSLLTGEVAYGGGGDFRQLKDLRGEPIMAAKSRSSRFSISLSTGPAWGSCLLEPISMHF